MAIELTGKKALVTGGARGVGRGIVLALARSGAEVITCCRQDSEAATSLEHELNNIGGQHHLRRMDLAEPTQIRDLLGECESRFGRLDLVVNNAAIISHIPYGDLPFEEWQRTLATNITAAHLVIQHALPLLREGSSVISISSKSIEVGIPLRAHYTTTKAALHGLTRTLAREFGGQGIRFNVLSLGMIYTEALDAMPEDRRREMLQRYGEKTALRRFGTPDEVADAVLWLASDHASYVTGGVIPVDGGIS